MIYEGWNGVGFRNTNGHSNHGLLIYEGWNAVGFRKTNPHSNRGLQDTKVGTELVFAKPTVIPTFGLNIRRLRCEDWNAVGFRKSNCQYNRCRACIRVGIRLVFVNPIVIPTMCFKVRRLECGWFSQNQPAFQPEAMIYEGWNVVGFRTTNRHSNHGLQYTKVGTRLVFAKPTVIPTMGYDIQKLERDGFSQNQPPFQPLASIS